METEIEAKFLRVNTDDVRRRLTELGATRTHPERLMGRYNFDFPDGRLERVGGWVRLRNEGDRTTLSYKQMNDRTLHGTKEVSVVVDSVEQAKVFLESIGLEAMAYQESKRETWELDDCEVTVDTWPWLPTFVEVEGPHESSVREVSGKLGFVWEDARHGSVEVAYQDVFDVSEEEIWRWPEVRFGQVPDWLEAKRKK